MLNEPYKLIKTLEGSGIGEVVNLDCSKDGSTLYAGGTGTGSKSDRRDKDKN